MKKKLKIICIFAAVSFILQTGVLLILNNKVFEGFSDDNITPVKNTASASKAEESDAKLEESNIKADIATDAKDISVSRSNKYIAYIDNDKINYVDTESNIKKTINDVVPMEYKWTSDDNIIITSKSDEYRNRVDIYLYDIATNNLKTIQHIKLNSSDSKIEQIICSPFKNIIFIKINEYNEDKLYKINIKNEIEEVNTVVKSISRMAIIPHEDKIIYKSDSLPKFYITYCDKKIKFDTDNEMVLLGVDEQDKIFIAEKNNDEIVNIYTGIMNDEVSTWDKIAVNKKMSIDNILISNDGAYYVDKEKSVIINLQTNKEIKYKGQVICINKDKAFVVHENKIESINL